MAEDYRGLHSPDRPWMVIHPYGLENRVDIDRIDKDQEEQWMIVSSLKFEHEYDAVDHMKELAEREGFLWPTMRYGQLAQK